MDPTPPTADLPEATPATSQRVTLQVVEGPHRGQSFAFRDHATFVVGRSPQAHFCLPEKDPYFSRLHFMIEVNPPLCRLLDMKSHNGTYVNGQRVASIDLRHGDEIRGGTTLLRVLIEGQPPMAEVAPPASAEVATTRTLPPASPPSTALSSSDSRTANLPDGTATALLQVSGAPALLPVIPGHEIVSKLGQGGMGVVYRARRASDGSDVAIKTILPATTPRPTTVQRFLREADILRKLRHAHIVAFREAGQAGDLLYFIMDFVEGIDAHLLVKQQGPLEVKRAVGLAVQVLAALAHAHAQGFVHRDLKPANLLVTTEGGKERIQVADFGLARAYQNSPLSGLTVSGMAAGTPQFMPPEQVLDFRSVKPAGDQYAAAATLYYLLTGQPPFEMAPTIQEFYRRILQEQPIPVRHRRADLPPALADVLHRALATKPEDRYSSVQEFARALQPFV